MSQEAKSWPDLVGKDANEAEQQIKAEGKENILMKTKPTCIFRLQS